MAIDVERRRPMLSTVTGGLSGPAVRPVAVRMVWQVAKAVEIPVVGLGGIATSTAQSTEHQRAILRPLPFYSWLKERRHPGFHPRFP